MYFYYECNIIICGRQQLCLKKKVTADNEEEARIKFNRWVADNIRIENKQTLAADIVGKEKLRGQALESMNELIDKLNENFDKLFHF
jgi:hypothetical protein